MKHLWYSLLLLFTLNVSGQDDFDPFADTKPKKEEAEFELISSHKSIAANTTFEVVVKMQVLDGWHAYYPYSGGASIGTTIEWELPTGFEVVDTIWPAPHITPFAGSLTYSYENTQYVLVRFKTPDSLQAGTEVTLAGTIGWQVCDSETCLTPNTSDVSLKLPVTSSAATSPAATELFSEISNKLPLTKEYGWDVSAEIKDKTLLIRFAPQSGNTTKLEKLYYFDIDGITDAQKGQTLKADGNAYTLSVPLNPKGSPKSQLFGVITSSTGWIKGKENTAIQINIPLKGAASVAQGTSAKANSGHSLLTASEEDRKAAAALYDVNAKVPYVLLDGTEEKSIGLFAAIGLIMLGGLLLNLMPCVFPVLGLKIMGFVQQAGEDSRKIKLHGLVFTAGVVISMWVLSGAIYALKYIWKVEFDWGDQLAYAPFLAAMILVLFVFGLNMAGVFELGTSLTGVGGELQAKKGYSGSFFSGVLTTLIATPCTGPFLGVVLGYTLAQPVITGMLIFTAFALGISIPYVVLSFFPKLIQKLPRPGAWMVTFKSIMAFALFASAGYFFKSFATQTGTEGAWWFIMAIIVISLACWAYGTWGTQATGKGKRYLWGYIFPLAVATLGIFMTVDAVKQRPAASSVASTDHGGITIHQWYPGIVELNRSKGRIVWLDYTAEW